MGLSLPAVAANATTTTGIGKTDAVMLLVLLSWHYLVGLIYVLINKLVAPKMGYSLGQLYKTMGWFFSGIEAILLITLLVILKSNVAKVFAGIYLLTKIIMVVAYEL
jgi:hypothetical protein